MRDFKGMKRQRGRNRGGGGGGKPQQNANRAFDSNGPDNVKVRGNAQHVFDKYQQLARDAASSGDRVLAENYLQHAEHYFRLLRAMQPQRPASEILGRDQFANGLDIDFEEEPGQQPAEAEADGEQEQGEADGERRGWQGRDDRQRDEGRRDDRQRDDRHRDDRQRDDRARDDRPREDRGARDDRDDRPRRDRYRDRDDRRERWRDRDDRPRGERADRDPLAVVEPQGDPLVAPAQAEQPAGPMLRDAEGGESQAPAFLQTRADPRPAAAEDGEEPVRKPRRRRAPRSFEGGEDAPAAESEEV